MRIWDNGVVRPMTEEEEEAMREWQAQNPRPFDPGVDSSAEDYEAALNRLGVNTNDQD